MYVLAYYFCIMRKEFGRRFATMDDNLFSIIKESSFWNGSLVLLKKYFI